MVGWYHWLSGQKSQQTQGDSEGQGACCVQFLGWQRVRNDLVTERSQFLIKLTRILEELFPDSVKLTIWSMWIPKAQLLNWQILLHVVPISPSWPRHACLLPPGILTTDVPVLSISLEIELNQNVPLLKVKCLPQGSPHPVTVSCRRIETRPPCWFWGVSLKGHTSFRVLCRASCTILQPSFFLRMLFPSVLPSKENSFI